MGRTLPISEVKTHLPELLTGIEEREEEIVVTRKGKPAAVLVNFAEYERLKATLDVLSDPALVRQPQLLNYYSPGVMTEAAHEDCCCHRRGCTGRVIRGCATHRSCGPEWRY